MTQNKVDLHIHISGGEGLYERGEAMVAHLDELGIRKAVLMTNIADTLDVVQICDNERLCEKYPERFAWMCQVGSRDAGQIYQKLAVFKARGAIGIGEFHMNRRLDDPIMQEVWAAAEKLELPILFHMSPEVGYSYGMVDEYGLPLLEQVLQQYPGLMLIGHSQAFWAELDRNVVNTRDGRMNTGEGPVTPGRVPELMARYGNLYADLSAGSGSNAMMRDPAYGVAFLTQFQDKLFFGTDMGNAKTVRPLAAWMEQELAAGRLEREVCEKIFHKNAERVFGL